MKTKNRTSAKGVCLVSYHSQIFIPVLVQWLDSALTSLTSLYIVALCVNHQHVLTGQMISTV